MPARFEIVVTVMTREPHAVPGAGSKMLAVTPADHTPGTEQMGTHC